MEFATTAGSFLKDRDWQRSANPKLQKANERAERADLAMMEKRRKQKLLQNMALEAQFKIKVKAPKF